MKKVELTRVAENGRAGAYRKPPMEDDCSRIIEGSSLVYSAGELMMVYLEDFDAGVDLPALLQKIKFPRYARVTGVAVETKVFGYQPRNPLYVGNNMCKVAKLAFEHPDAHAALESVAPRLQAVYGKYGREKHDLQVATVKERLRPEYVMAGSCFTSGVVNRNNPLVYHYDAGNFKGCWSAMLAYKHGIAGGNLALPDYDAKVMIKDRSLLLFDGQRELHGVTPIVRLHAQAYRYTVVYYALEQLWKCLPHRDELRRAQVERTQTEMKNALRVKNKALTPGP